jgi:hypothetical protein
MNVDNPLADNPPTEYEDQSLVMRARSGDREHSKTWSNVIRSSRRAVPIRNLALRALRR